MSDVLLYLVKTNSATTYFKESAVLPQFWAALPLADGNQIDNLDFSTTELFKVYHNNVGQSIYEDYLPVISHFFEHPCNRIAVENLMTPDLPSLLPTPRHMSKAMAERVRLANRQGKNGAGKNCIIFSLACRQVIALDEDGNIAKDIPVCLLTSGLGRIENNMAIFRPDRAEESRRVRKATDSPGWLRQILPQLCAILANASGPFSTVIPEIRRYAGPDVSGPYNLYKVVGSDDVIEFLPVGEPEESKYLAQSVVERLIGKDIRSDSDNKRRILAVHRAGKSLLGTHCWWNYLAILIFNISAAPSALHDQLQGCNENYLKDSRVGKIGVPRVRVVRLGTSGDLKRMEGQDDGGALWQVKVPVIIWGESGRAWLEERVMFDI
ncbi:hypothetical protein M404DRAFT_34112 [Pisolithus tinctorius Marx 270]|uniref:Uncharacterized protein n=1 Tax=Pisolithus tinctorius Marx 270 TaxID=870435 RepID=A0A0C3N358_PISTI|nr:hypothetical protein M404DRAFT_34112 [Pisolithus tinctorius Marx 270]